MIRQQFDVRNYWRVIVFWNLDYDFSDIVVSELHSIGFNYRQIDKILYELSSGYAKAATCSNENKHISIILLNPHTSIPDYFNSIIHEAVHVKQAMLRVYNVKDEGEAPAYTMGYLIMRMYPVFKELL